MEIQKYIINNYMGSLIFKKKESKSNIDSPQNMIKSEHTESLTIVASLVLEIINKALKENNNNNIPIPPPNIPSISEHNTNNNINSHNGKKPKKKDKGFFLYSTQKKKKEQSSHPKPFIAKLNSDIISYNQTITDILSQLLPLKEYVINEIKSQIAIGIGNLCTYDLEIYGSYQSGLDIESSDIDLLFKPHCKKKFTSSQLMLIISNYFISLNQYEKVNPIYTATIPLIKLMIIPVNFIKDQKNEAIKKYFVFRNSELYQSYPYSKSELDVINVDISFPNHTKKNTPRIQLEYIKQSLNENIEIKPIVKILKRLLKITFLNNSYKGGLSSYSLFLLSIAFNQYLKTKKNNNTSNYLAHFFNDMIKFYSTFNFDKMIVNVTEEFPFIETDVPGEGVPTIIDPVTMLNAGKSSFNIVEVVNMLGGVMKIINDLKASYEQGKEGSNKSNFINEIMKQIVK